MERPSGETVRRKTVPCGVGVANKGDTPAIGRARWAAITGIIGEPQDLHTVNQGRIVDCAASLQEANPAIAGASARTSLTAVPLQCSSTKTENTGAWRMRMERRLAQAHHATKELAL